MKQKIELTIKRVIEIDLDHYPDGDLAKAIECEMANILQNDIGDTAFFLDRLQDHEVSIAPAGKLTVEGVLQILEDDMWNDGSAVIQHGNLMIKPSPIREWRNCGPVENVGDAQKAIAEHFDRIVNPVEPDYLQS